jgi:hypothetical protein
MGCKSIPKAQQITIGSGGGFTNLWHKYTLSPNGDMHHYVSNYDTTFLEKKITQSLTKKMFEQVEALKLDSLAMDEPGNISYFIEFSEGEKFKYKIQWNNQNKAPDSVLTFFEDFKALLKKE